MPFIDEIASQFKDLEASLNGLSKSRLHQIRQNAYQAFMNLGLPTLKNEEYRYLPVGKFLDKNITQIDSEKIKIEKDVLSKMIPENLNGHLIVLVNGKYYEDLSDADLPQNVSANDYTHLLNEPDDSILDRLDRNATSNDAFVTLNTAFAGNGFYLKVDPQTKVEKPLVVLHVTASGSEPQFSQERNLIHVGENSQVEIIEIYKSLGTSSSFLNSVTDITIRPNARVEHTKVQEQNDQSGQVNYVEVHQEETSYYNDVTVTLDGKLVRNNHHVTIDAAGCEAHLIGLYLLKGDSVVDNHTSVDHRKPHSYSNELYKGILDDKSTGVFNGKIYVQPEAQKTNAFQSNKNILLSDDASVNTKPQLEIWADDVKCSHGCTTGQLNEDQIFYLRSRGIGFETARAMVLYAFAADIVENIKNKALREYLENKISERLQP